MDIDQTTLFTTMLHALILKYGVMLTTKDCAETLGISTRTLDERRKSFKNCPEYIDSSKSIMFPAQNVIQYQLIKSQQSIKVLNS